MKASDPAAWYRRIKLITHGPQDHTPVIVPGVDQSDQQSIVQIANRINDHFCSIASDLPPLDRNKLPAFLPAPDQCPQVEPLEVYRMLKTLNQRKSSITGDLPVRILREFACELASPLANVLNASFQQGVVPHIWKCAEIVPIPKCQPPTLQNLRPIALTSYFAKIAESFMAKWLLEDISKHIDSNQFENRKGLSTNHYLIQLLHQILENAELPKTISTLVFSDFSKAFDKIDHNVLVNKLLSMGVRPCLVSWIISFLEHRAQCVKYSGSMSNWNTIDAGVPQGTKLGPILFLIMINDACEAAPIRYLKYVDDLTLIESRKLTQQPLMQDALNDFSSWTGNNNMKLNPTKCCTMQVTFCKRPPPPEPLFIDNVKLSVVTEAKILGIVVQANLKWDSHILQVVKKCNRKLYMLRSLKRFHIPLIDLVTVYSGYIRPVLEYGTPVFNGALTKKQESQLETIQKRACKIMLGTSYSTYAEALVMCNIGTLLERRKKLCIDFAHSLEKNPLVFNWLPQKPNHDHALRSKKKYEMFKCKTKRFQDSSIPYLIRLLNSETS